MRDVLPGTTQQRGAFDVGILLQHRHHKRTALQRRQSRDRIDGEPGCGAISVPEVAVLLSTRRNRREDANGVLDDESPAPRMRPLLEYRVAVYGIRNAGHVALLR